MSWEERFDKQLEGICYVSSGSNQYGEWKHYSQDDDGCEYDITPEIEQLKSFVHQIEQEAYERGRREERRLLTRKKLELSQETIDKVSKFFIGMLGKYGKPYHEFTELQKATIDDDTRRLVAGTMKVMADDLLEALSQPTEERKSK